MIPNYRFQFPVSSFQLKKRLNFNLFLFLGVMFSSPVIHNIPMLNKNKENKQFIGDKI